MSCAEAELDRRERALFLLGGSTVGPENKNTYCDILTRNMHNIRTHTTPSIYTTTTNAPHTAHATNAPRTNASRTASALLGVPAQIQRRPAATGAKGEGASSTTSRPSGAADHR